MDICKSKNILKINLKMMEAQNCPYLIAFIQRMWQFSCLRNPETSLKYKLGLFISCNLFFNLAVVLHCIQEAIIMSLGFLNLLLYPCQLVKSLVSSLFGFPLITSIQRNFNIYLPLHSIFLGSWLKKTCFVHSKGKKVMDM